LIATIVIGARKIPRAFTIFFCPIGNSGDCRRLCRGKPDGKSRISRLHFKASQRIIDFNRSGNGVENDTVFANGKLFVPAI